MPEHAGSPSERGPPGGRPEKAVADAMFAAECLHGAARVRLGAGYFLGKGREPQCVIDTSTPGRGAGRPALHRLLSRSLGDEAFSRRADQG